MTENYQAVLERLATSTHFDDELVRDVARANDAAVFLVALRRSDCPPLLLMDLWQARAVEVRRVIAAHPNTPKNILERLAGDEDAEVASRALERLS